MAQSKSANLFTVIDLPKNLTDEQTEMVAKIEKYPNLAKVTYVSIADVNALQRNGFLDFGIPNEPTKTIPRLKLKRLEVTDSDNSFAYGMLEGDFGELMFRNPSGSTNSNNFIVSKTANIFSEIFPNPTSSVAAFDYNLVEPTHLKVVLIDGLGKTVKTLINENKQVGYYQHKMEASDLNAGFYFLQIVSDKQTLTKKILIQH